METWKKKTKTTHIIVPKNKQIPLTHDPII